MPIPGKTACTQHHNHLSANWISGNLGAAKKTPHTKSGYHLNAAMFDSQPSTETGLFAWQEMSLNFHDDKACKNFAKADMNHVDVTMHMSTCNNIYHSDWGFTVNTEYEHNNHYNPPVGHHLKFAIFMDPKCTKEVGLMYANAENACIPNGLTFANLISSGYTQTCHTDSAGIVHNPYTNFKDRACRYKDEDFADWSFAPGCLKWVDAGADPSFGNPNWYFKASCGGPAATGGIN